MKFKLFMAGLLFAASLNSFACDVCGGGGSGNFQGVVPLFGQNQFAFRMNYFAAIHHDMTYSSPLPSSNILEDHFFQQELSYRKFTSKKMIYSFSVPLGINTRIETARTTQIKGVGDIQLGASRILVNTSDSSFHAVKHILTAGFGLSLPTGKYMQRDETLLRLPANFQLGKGAYAYSFNLYYVLRRKNIGLAFNAQERLYSENELRYQFGNASTLSAVGFYRWNLENNGTTILPQCGIACEHQVQDFSYGIAEFSTGGTQTWGNLAIDIYRGRWAYGINLQRKISSSLPAGMAESNVRFGLQATYRISQKK
jgi:hypothetical protein